MTFGEKEKCFLGAAESAFCFFILSEYWLLGHYPLICSIFSVREGDKNSLSQGSFMVKIQYSNLMFFDTEFAPDIAPAEPKRKNSEG